MPDDEPYAQAIGDALSHTLPEEAEWIVLYQLPGETKTRVCTTLDAEASHQVIKMLAQGRPVGPVTQFQESDTH